jgi:hypothetical protein
MIKCLIFALPIAVVVYASLPRGELVNTVIPDQRRPDLAAMFNGRYTQYVDHFGNAARAAFDASGNRLGVQVGKYSHDAPNEMIVEMVYLEPDTDHSLGQVFDAAGNPMGVQTGPGNGRSSQRPERDPPLG